MSSSLRRSPVWLGDPRVKPPGVAEVDLAHPLSRGLLACWLFESSPSLDPDLVLGIPLTPNTTPPTVVVSETGHAYDFSASGRRLTPTSDTRYRPTDQITIELRMKQFSSSGDQKLVHLGPAGQTSGYAVECDNGNGSVSVYVRGDSTTSPSGVINDGRVHHVVGVYNGARVSVYVDGVERAGTNTSGSISYPGQTLAIGNIAAGVADQPFQGWIEYVRIWNRGLSAAEVAWLNAEPFGMFRPAGVRRRLSAFDLLVTPPPAGASAASTCPAVSIAGTGGIVFSPACSDARTSQVNPTVILGSITITPTVAAAVAARVNPTVILGSMAVTPAMAAAVTALVNPTVIVDNPVAPAARTAAAASVNPEVEINLFLIQHTWEVKQPLDEAFLHRWAIVSGLLSESIQHTWTVRTTFALRHHWRVMQQALIDAHAEDVQMPISYGQVPQFVSAAASRINPTVVLGSMIIVPVAANAAGTVVNPTVVIA